MYICVKPRRNNIRLTVSIKHTCMCVYVCVCVCEREFMCVFLIVCFCVFLVVCFFSHCIHSVNVVCEINDMHVYNTTANVKGE